MDIACNLEARIRRLAYNNWEAAGCPLTTDEDRQKFWYEAEMSVLTEDEQKERSIRQKE